MRPGESSNEFIFDESVEVLTLWGGLPDEPVAEMDVPDRQLFNRVSRAMLHPDDTVIIDRGMKEATITACQRIIDRQGVRRIADKQLGFLRTAIKIQNTLEEIWPKGQM